MRTNTKAIAAATKLAVSLARVASNVAASETERQTATDKLAEHCTKHGLNVADILATAAQPDTGPTPLDIEARAKRAADRAAAKPNTDHKAEAAKRTTSNKPDETPKAAKPSKPSAADAKRAGEYDARVKLVNELRTTASVIYNGPSLAVRSNPKRVAASVYADLLANPKHRTTLAKISERDTAFLFAVIKRGSASGAFDPVTLNLDAGIFSRLASVGFIVAGTEPGSYQLTPDALTQARRTAKQAAPAKPSAKAA